MQSASSLLAASSAAALRRLHRSFLRSPVFTSSSERYSSLTASLPAIPCFFSSHRIANILPHQTHSDLHSPSTRHHQLRRLLHDDGGASSSSQTFQNLPPKLADIVMHFKLAPDSRAKYEQLVNYGKKLKPLPRQYQTLENKVPNCVSQIWVRASIDKAKRIYFEAESDSMVARGVAAVLVEGLSGYPATDILKISPDFIELLTPEQSLTPLRSEGFMKVFRFLQKKASQAIDAEGISGSAKSFTQ